MKGDTYTFVFRCRKCEEWHEETFKSMTSFRKHLENMKKNKNEPFNLRFLEQSDAVPFSEYLYDEMRKLGEN